MSTSSAIAPIPSFELLAPADEPLTAEITETGKPRVWTAFAALLLAAIAGQLAVLTVGIAVGFGSGFIMGVTGVDQATIPAKIQTIFQNPAVSLIVTLLPFQLAMALVVVYAARRSKEPFKARLGLLPASGRKVGIVKLTALAAFTLAAGLTISILSVIYGGSVPASPVSGIVAGGSVWGILLLSVLISIVPALVEETFFRGYLQRRFLERWSPAVAIGVTTLLFAVMHFDSLTHIVAVIPLGIVTGLVAYRTNSVKPGMVVHALHNVGTVVFSASVMMFGGLVSEETLGYIVFGTFIVLGLIGLPVVISLLRRGKQTNITELVSVFERSAEAETVNRPEAIQPDFAFDSQLASAV
jgi:membrane protease YdiL (CAAX protease family)